MNLENVCVYCASSPRTNERYLEAASQLGTELARASLTVYYGGGAVGMMGALADAALAAGGKVVGVRPAFISGIEDDHRGVTEMIVTKTLHERKSILMERGHAFVALPGAIGTLDELVETITLKRLGIHSRPICILNLDGLFDPLLQQFQRMVEDQLVPPALLFLFECTADVPGVMRCLGNHHAVTEPAPLLWSDA